MAESDEDFYEVPLKDQRYFGAGIKRKRIHFVPSTTSLPASPGFFADGKSKSSASQRYLDVVFKRSRSEPPHEDEQVSRAATDDPDGDIKEAESLATNTSAEENICEVCKAPIDSSTSGDKHASSLVHQICRPHAHPPSAIDRNRKGIGILQAYGWDPDARVGLGAGGEGILHPVKAKEKRDTAGLGVGMEDDEEAKLKPRKKKERPQDIKKLDAGQIRKLDLEQKRKDKKLREMFYANDDVEKYLGHH